MFLLPHTTTTTPFMAQITSDSPTSNPIFGFPSLESSQTDHGNNSVNLPSLHDPAGLYMTMYNRVGVRNAADEYSKSRKRGREEDLGPSTAWINTKIATGLIRPSPNGLIENHTCSPSSSSYGGGEIYTRMLREQQELDLFILMHTEKLRVELEKKRRHHWSNTLHVVEERLQRIIKWKDEEIEKMSRRNTELEEKVKMLVMEGQIWKSLAQSNEATAISLRRDLEMAQVREGEGDSGPVEDSMSCCDWEKKKEEEAEEEEEEEEEKERSRRRCHGCRRNEMCVLVLPCRHLCLCSDCDPQFESCPLCMSPKSATIKVHMS